MVRVKKYIKIFIDNAKSLHILYAVIAIVIGSAFIIFTPPFHGPDEEQHFFKAYQVSKGDLFMDRLGDNRLSYCIDEDVVSLFYDSSMKPNIRGLISEKYEFDILSELGSGDERRTGGCLVVDTTNTYTYAPFVYLPSVVGILISKMFDAPAIWGLYLARLSTLVATVLIIALAIKIIPRRKLVMFVVALIPTMVFQQSVISADGLSYALLALMVAYVLRIRSMLTDVSRLQWAIVLVLSSALVMTKPLMFIFTPLILMLYQNGHKLKVVAILTISAILAISGLVLPGVYYPGVENHGAEGSNSSAQVENIIDNPTRVIEVAWNTYTGPFQDSQSLGVLGSLGTSDVIIPVWLYTVIAVNIALVFLVVTVRDRPRHITKRFRLIAISSMVLYYAAVHGAMYVTYSPLDFDIVYGVQGRYFLPLLIVLLVVVPGCIVVKRVDYRKLSKYLVWSTVLVLFMALILLVQRYYFETP